MAKTYTQEELEQIVNAAVAKASKPTTIPVFVNVTEFDGRNGAFYATSLAVPKDAVRIGKGNWAYLQLGTSDDKGQALGLVASFIDRMAKAEPTLNKRTSTNQAPTSGDDKP